METASASTASKEATEQTTEQTTEVNKDATASAHQSIITSKRKRCIRLDVRHHRNIFLTMLYGIIMYRRRHVLLTLLQLFIPPLILIGMTTYLGKLLYTEKKDWTHYAPLNEEELLNNISEKAGDGEGVLTCYMQNNNTLFAIQFASRLEALLQDYNTQLLMVGKEDDFLRRSVHYHVRGESNKFIGGIHIDNPPANPKSNNTNGIDDKMILRFKIAIASNTPGFQFRKPPITFFDIDKNKPEMHYTLLGVQLAVCRTFYDLIKSNRQDIDVNANITETGGNITVAEGNITEIEGNKTETEGNNTTDQGLTIEVEGLPYPEHSAYSAKHNKSVAGFVDESDDMDSMLATIIVLGMVPAFFTVVEGPVTEKENGFKLYLLLMGYPRGAYWFSWIFNQLLVQIIVSGVLVWLVYFPFDPHTGSLIKFGDKSLWIFMFILLNLACLTFFTFLAAFFRRGKMATYLGILIWTLSFHILQSHMPSFDYDTSLTSFMFSCLVPCGGIHWAIFILTTSNANTWEANLNFFVTPKSEFTLVHVVIMLVVDFFLYFCLTLYVDNLHPGPHEPKQPWNYFFQGIRCRYIDPNRDFLEDNDYFQSDANDFDPASSIPRKRISQGTNTSIPAIEFQNLSKKFHFIAGYYAVKNANFTVNSKSITVVLGHKDCGRTTLMRLLCGEYTPTTGTALVFGYNVKHDNQKVQSFISVCLEQNALCQYLTVMEHMTLIGKLKGLSSKDAKRKSEKLLESLDLLSIKKYAMWQLVNWQRRVLCVAMALLGNSPILLLDEPTKNLDLDAKRLIWALLKEFKSNGKTILMSTSDIDEAYLVADRIVIMSRGRVAGVGTPSKLEYLFQTGYHLTLQVIPSVNWEEVFTFIKDIIPSVRELEGGFTAMKRAIRVSRAIESQDSLDISEDKDDMLTNNLNDFDNASKGESIFTFMLGRTFKKAMKKENETIVPPPPKPIVPPIESVPTVLHMNTASNGTNAGGGELNYVLRFDEAANFPKLFKALENSNTMLGLGIKSYEVKLHNMKQAFDEMDDYIDVLNTTPDPIQFNLADFVDLMALRSSVINHPDPDRISLPSKIPEHKIKTRILYSLCALMKKRMCHILGNYRHALIQITAPVIILIVTILTLNTHFKHVLTSNKIAYAANESLYTVVPYITADNISEASKNFLTSYKNVLHNVKNIQNIGSSTVRDYYKEEYGRRLHRDISIAGDFSQIDQGKVKALFSVGKYHAPELSLLVMFNALLKYEFPGKKYGVEMEAASISPQSEWVLLMNDTFSHTLTHHSVDITLTVSIAFGYFIFTSGFVTQSCHEKLCLLKRYQMHTLKWNGLYWIGTAFIDMISNVIVISLLTLTIYFLPDHEVFRNREFLILFFITGSLGGFASILNSYFWSHFLRKHSTSYYATLSINQFFGLFIFLLYSILNLEYLGKHAPAVVVFSLQIIIQPFSVVYNFYMAIGWALRNARCAVLHKAVKDEMCDDKLNDIPKISEIREGCCSAEMQNFNVKFIWDNIALLANVSILFGHCIIWIFVLMFMESRRLRKKLFRMSSNLDAPPALKNENDEKSIEKETEFVDNALKNKDSEKVFLVKNVGTASSKRDLLYRMTFAVEAGKCTAIVGPEASGITILYNILSGIRAVSEGNVFYGGNSLLYGHTRKKFLRQLGLSPADDITIERLTGLQLLMLFGRLRGIPSKDLTTHTEYWTKALDMEKVIRKQCQYYSAVTKKKLGIALAVIGNPPVIILDEPTKDLDPLSKCKVCKVMENLLRDNRIVLILTHDLSSIERICNKLIFLVNGQMQFCANTEDVNKDIANQFTLIINLKGGEGGTMDVKSYVGLKSELEKQIKGIALQEEQSHSLLYRIRSEESRWVTLFEITEKIISAHSEVVADHYIRKTSLMDVYNSYALNQRAFRMRQSAWDEFQMTYC